MTRQEINSVIESLGRAHSNLDIATMQTHDAKLINKLSEIMSQLRVIKREMSEGI